MKRTLEILVVLGALVIIGRYAWQHKGQALAKIYQSCEPAQVSPTPNPDVQTSNQHPISIVNNPTEINSHEPSDITVIELTKVPLTGKNESFTTLDGDKYSGVIKRVEPDGIVLRTTEGVSKLKFKNLPSEIAQKYGYDPELENKFLRKRAKEDAATYQSALQLNEAKQKEAIAAEAEKQKRAKEASDYADAMNKPSIHIKVIQVTEDGVLADQMESASTGGSMSRMGGSSGWAGMISYQCSGHIIYISGIKDVADDAELSIKAKRDGVYQYVSTSGSNRTVEKYTLLAKVGN
jgi:hypothetical protein